MKQFLRYLSFLALIIFAGCAHKQSASIENFDPMILEDHNTDQLMVWFKNEDIVRIYKNKRVVEIPYKYLKVSELMSVLEVEDKGVGEVNAYGDLTAWIGWKYPFEFTFVFPDSSRVINYYISEDSIVDLKNIYVKELEVKVRSKQLQLDLSKDTIVIN